LSRKQLVRDDDAKILVIVPLLSLEVGFVSSSGEVLAYRT